MFIKYNCNPRGRVCGDCVIRALSKALEKSWEEVLDDLYKIAKEIKTTCTDRECYKRYLKDYQMIQFNELMYVTSDGRKKRLTVGQFAEEHPSGTYVVDISGHQTVIVNGDIYDLWNCSNKCPYTVWRIN